MRVQSTHLVVAIRSGTADLNADLIRADLSQAGLTGADLVGADLTEAKLSEAKLSGAILSVARLDGANLTEADLTGADLSGAILTGADLIGADFTPAADLTGARWNSETTWPSAAFAAEIRDRSNETSRGVFEVRGDAGRSSSVQVPSH
jgi:uncharacterized protein YjbI with pentapeptide repeats